MEITFQGHSPCERSITVDEADFANLNDIIRTNFLESIEFGSYDGYLSRPKEAIVAFCNKYGVDSTYKLDRLAFFKAILG